MKVCKIGHMYKPNERSAKISATMLSLKRKHLLSQPLIKASFGANCFIQSCSNITCGARHYVYVLLGHVCLETVLVSRKMYLLGNFNLMCLVFFESPVKDTSYC